MSAQLNRLVHWGDGGAACEPVAFMLGDTYETMVGLWLQGLRDARAPC